MTHETLIIYKLGYEASRSEILLWSGETKADTGNGTCFCRLFCFIIKNEIVIVGASMRNASIEKCFT